MTKIQRVSPVVSGPEKPAKPQLLMLTHRVPYPPDRGDRIRSWNMIRHLSQLADISLACVSNESIHPDAEKELKQVCRRVAVATVGNRSRWIRAGLSLASGRSMTEGLFWSPRLATTLDHWADVVPFDAGLIYCSSMMPYMRRTTLKDIPKVVDLVDVDSQKWNDYAAHSKGWKRWVYTAEANRVRSIESEILRTSHAVTLASDAEAELFRNSSLESFSQIHGISNGVDTEFFHPSVISPMAIPQRLITSVGSSKLRMVFVGVLDYLPNMDGLRWFAEHVWPKLKGNVPAATLEIIGRNPTAALRKLLLTDGIEIVGSVDDVRPYLAGADLVIAPLRIARGIQNKVLEAMAMGKTVMATSQAAEGIDAVADKHFLIADSATEWINSLVGLSKHPDVLREIGMSARKLIVEEYTWPVRLHRLSELLGFASP